MKGKRVIAISVTVILLLLSLTSSLSALDAAVTADAEVAMNPLQISVFKFSARRKGLDTCETARAILQQIGYPESIINVMPEDKLLQVVDSRWIETKEEYVCISPDGEAVSSSKAQYEAEQNASKGISVLTTKPSTPTENSWAKLQTWVMQGNTDRTSYSYSASCTWLTRPIWRMDDYIAIGVTQGSVNPDSSLSVFTYTRTDLGTGASTDEYRTKTGQNEIPVPGTYAYAFFNLPDNLASGNADGTVSGIIYTGFSMMIWLNGTMTNASSTVPMNVVSAYFHKVIAIDISAEVSLNGAALSISPKGMFNKIINNVEYTHSM